MTLTTESGLDELVRRVATGDKDALRLLYEREAPRLHGIALRIVRRPDAAADAVQEGFIQVWKNARAFDPEAGSAAAWLTGVVRYRALDAARRFGRESLTAEVPDRPDDSPDPLSLLESARDGAALRRCLDRLDLKNRRAIVLAFVDGLSHSQVAERLDTPLGTVKAWIRRGLMSLRECLSP